MLLLVTDLICSLGAYTRNVVSVAAIKICVLHAQPLMLHRKCKSRRLGTRHHQIGCVKQLVVLASLGRGVETKYLVRMLAQNLRVGANWRSIVSALARAVLLHRSAGAVSHDVLFLRPEQIQGLCIFRPALLL